MAPFPEKIITNWRFEYKYRLTYQQYYRIRNAIVLYMKKDRYTIAASSGRYLVRSLYFDSYNLKNYEEKVNGDRDRVKLRIRTYSAKPDKNINLRTELKARKGMIVEKYNSWVSLPDYQAFMSSWHWSDQSDAVLAEFERYILLKNQQPKIIVEYDREGYAARRGEEVRVTFDHKVRSANAKTLFPEMPFFRKHYPGYIVFEVKCIKVQPPWLRELVMQHGLRITTNSKYVQGLEAARTDLVRV